MDQHSQKCTALYLKSEDLKKSMLQQRSRNRSFKDPRLQEYVGIVQTLLLIDLEYALSKKSELDLWNAVFKETISGLQAEQSTEARANLKWFLDYASGFYIMLLQEICVAYDLDLPFLRSAAFYGVAQEHEPFPTEIKKCKNVASINYICTHCLVKLGDLLRYKGNSKQAETFYRHSLTVAPSSGHAYNQLALLEVSKGSYLTPVFYYVRALSLKCPFPAASSNLSRMYTKIMTTFEGSPKISYINKFLLAQSYLHCALKIPDAANLIDEFCEELRDNVVAEMVKVKDMIKCICIAMFHLNQVQAAEDNSLEEKVIHGLEVKLLVGFLDAFLLPVSSTIKEGPALADFNVLPVIKLIMDWIILNPEAVAQSAFKNKSQLWRTWAKLLNDLNALPKSENLDEYSDFPLPEEFDVQAFLPLCEQLKNYNFRQILKGCTLDVKLIKNLRVSRVLCQGHMVSTWAGEKVLGFSDNSFHCPDTTVVSCNSLEEDLQLLRMTQPKAAEVLEAEVPVAVSKAVKKKAKNVAMEAILKQAERKQVSFQSPSPNFSDSSSNSQPSSTISQEDNAQKPAFLTKNVIKPVANISSVAGSALPMDFSVPPPPILQHRAAGPATLAWSDASVNLQAPSYQLFGGNGPAWCIPSRPMLTQTFNQPVQRPTVPGPRQPLSSTYLFQPGPSALEELLRQNPKRQQ